MSKDIALKAFHDAAIKQESLLKTLQIDVDVFQRILANALIKSPAIAKCTRDSLYTAVYDCANYGIMPDGKHGVIVPIKRKGVVVAEFWPMVDGLLCKVRENIPGIAINAQIVYEDDEWSDERGTSPCLIHRPHPKASRGDKDIVCMYATAFMPGNAVPEYEVMYLDQLLEMKKNNKGPWSTNFQEMAKVRPMKRVIKRLPITGKLMAQLALEPEEDGDLDDEVVIDGEPEKETAPTSTRKRGGRDKKPAADKPKEDPAPDPGENEEQVIDGDDVSVVDDDDEPF